MKTSDVLRAAAEKIATPEKWCQGWFAYDACGNDCRGRSQGADPNAVQWCIAGACQFVTGEACPDAWAVLNRVIGESLSIWNDSKNRTHIEVLSALKRAAELAESEGQ